jgi:hypothetical protein
VLIQDVTKTSAIEGDRDITSGFGAFLGEATIET